MDQFIETLITRYGDRIRQVGIGREPRAERYFEMERELAVRVVFEEGRSVDVLSEVIAVGRELRADFYHMCEAIDSGTPVDRKICTKIVYFPKTPLKSLMDIRLL